MRERFAAIIVGIVSLVVFSTRPSAAQPFGEICYKVKDPARVSMVGIDVFDSYRPALPHGCRISKAATICNPASVTPGPLTVNKAPATPTGLLGPVPAMDGTGVRVCYKLKCPVPSGDPSETPITDGLASRSFGKFTATELCLQAKDDTLKDGETCGDGMVSGGEECDPAGASACPNDGVCANDCLCHGQAACCSYASIATVCVENRGRTGDLAPFLANCNVSINPIVTASGALGSCPTVGCDAIGYTGSYY